MQWILDNWQIVRLAIEAHSYFNVMINPLGIAASALFVIMAVLMAGARRKLLLLVFLAWSITGLHHLTLEDAVPEAGSTAGLPAIVIFAAGAIVIGGTAIYYAIVQD